MRSLVDASQSSFPVEALQIKCGRAMLRYEWAGSTKVTFHKEETERVRERSSSRPGRDPEPRTIFGLIAYYDKWKIAVNGALLERLVSCPMMKGLDANLSIM
uniref:SFRICE_027550 n=1 Tax=Spodoptera frugiperda TaxID=7108 RepID=A0A2H1W898_SPOFR